MSGQATKTVKMRGGGEVVARLVNCRACSVRMIFGTVVDAEGNVQTNARGEPVRIPLDSSAPVYTVVGVTEAGELLVRQCAAFVSHFTTCPKAAKFSKSGKGRRS